MKKNNIQLVKDVIRSKRPDLSGMEDRVLEAIVRAFETKDLNISDPGIVSGVLRYQVCDDAQYQRLKKRAVSIASGYPKAKFWAEDIAAEILAVMITRGISEDEQMAYLARSVHNQCRKKPVEKRKGSSGPTRIEHLFIDQPTFIDHETGEEISPSDWIDDNIEGPDYGEQDEEALRAKEIDDARDFTNKMVDTYARKIMTQEEVWFYDLYCQEGKCRQELAKKYQFTEDEIKTLSRALRKLNTCNKRLRTDYRENPEYNQDRTPPPTRYGGSGTFEYEF